jgi:hypothetical protein
MRRDETGNDCPSTLGEYRDMCAALGGDRRSPGTGNEERDDARDNRSNRQKERVYHFGCCSHCWYLSDGKWSHLYCNNRR